jgi:hypothetical protein
MGTFASSPRNEFVRWSAVLALGVMLALARASADGQDGDAGTVARTPWGDPDLSGVWDFRTLTPLERPSEFAGKEFFSDEDAAKYEDETVRSLDKDRRTTDGLTAEQDVRNAYNQFWWDYGTKLTSDRRTSLIVDPPDGRIPPRTPEAQKRFDARAAALERPAEGPEDRTPWERCILGFNAGPPMNPSAYNNNVHLFQVPGYVVILTEMVHDARIVPMDGRPHLPPHIRQWRGDSRGRWEGNTLVVDTTNFTDKTSFRGSGAEMHLSERFTRLDADTLLYEYTIDDPESFTRAWSAAVPMTRTEEPMFEYACHEGNYGMFNLLEGARAQERLAEEGAKTKSNR